MELVVRPLDGSGSSAQQVEVVERKGLGHPDTLCDGIAENVSRVLCRHYLDRFGEILHHNVDKVLLVGGAARAAFGGGEMLEPIELYLAGRATSQVGDVRIAVDEIAVEACRAWLKANLHEVDVDRHVRIVPRLRPGSADLRSLFSRQGRAALANDTSCGVGFAPMTDLERVVLAVERTLNDCATKGDHPAIGEDIKVMGVRSGARITLTIGCALIGRHLPDLSVYEQMKEHVRARATAAAQEVCGSSVEVVVNAADDLARGDVFLTVIGTSAESGDDGEVGRGNRQNGLITPCRPMTMEAVAGKNPVTHVGKLYNLAASRIASALVAELADVTDATCMLVSQIGRPVHDPHIADVRLRVASGSFGPRLREETGQIVRAALAGFSGLRDEILRGEVNVY